MSQGRMPDPRSISRRAVMRLVGNLLRPLVMLMLRHGIGIYEFMELARWQFAQVGIDRELFGVEGRRAWATSRSRCAVLTGMTRRQADRQLKLDSPATEEAREAFDRLEKLLQAWRETPGYQDQAGKPLALPLRGAAPSLERLARLHCRDVPVRALLDELLRREMVTRDAEGRITISTCVSSEALPDLEELEALETVGSDIAALLVQRFRPAPGPAQFREVRSVPVTVAEAVRLQLHIERHAQEFLAQARQELADVKGGAPDNPRAVVGLYWGLR